MNSMLKLARREILEMRAYVSARSLSKGFRASIYLDANESPVPGKAGTLWNRYPEPQPPELLAAFADLYGVGAENLVIGRGSDEAIDLLVRAFCRSGEDAILICPPTYGMYQVAADLQGAIVLAAPLLLTENSTSLDLTAIRRALDTGEGKIKIIFLCSPNNPTGTAFPKADLRAVCEFARDRALVVVDEAYVEFSSESSMASEIGAFENLVVLRTLSKAWGLAGLRCGVAIAEKDLIQLLQKVRAPYPISAPVVEAVANALGTEGRKALVQRIECSLEEKQSLAQALAKLDIVEGIFTSDANFLLVRFGDAARVMDYVKLAGILLRDRSREPGLANCIRITVGSAEENQRLLVALQEVKP